MANEIINLKYSLIRKLKSGDCNAFIAKDRRNQSLCLLFRLRTTDIFRKSDIKNRFYCSRHFSTKHIARYTDAGHITCINGISAQNAGYFLVSPIIGSDLVDSLKGISTEEQSSILFKIAFTLREISGQSCGYDDLHPDNVILTEKGPVLLNPDLQTGKRKSDPLSIFNGFLNHLEKTGISTGKCSGSALSFLKTGSFPDSELIDWQKDFYLDPTTWLLNLENVPMEIIESIEYAEREDWNCINVVARWDYGFGIIIDEVVAERQFAGICILDIPVSRGDSLHKLFSEATGITSGNSEEVYSRIVELSLNQPVDIFLRVMPSAGDDEWAQISDLLRTVTTGRIITIIYSQDDALVPEIHRLRLFSLSSNTELLQSRLYKSNMYNSSMFIPLNASSFENYQIYTQFNSPKVIPPYDGKAPSRIACAASELPGISLDIAAEAAGIDKYRAEKLAFGEGIYITRNFSGSRLWYRRENVSVSREVKENIRKVLLSAGCDRLHEIYWLLENKCDSDSMLAEIFAGFWRKEKGRLKQEQEINLLSDAAEIFPKLEKGVARRIILDLLRNGFRKTGTLEKFQTTLDSYDLNTGEMKLVMKLLKAYTLKNSFHSGKEIPLTFEILEEKWEPEIAEELELAIVLFSDSRPRGKDRRKIESIINRLTKWLGKLDEFNLFSSVLVTKASLLHWWNEKDEAFSLLETIPPPDENRQPQTAIRYNWLYFLREANQESGRLEKALEHMKRIYYLARINNAENAIPGSLLNIAVAAQKAGDIITAEAIDEMKKVNEMSKALSDGYSEVVAQSNIVDFHISLMNSKLIDKPIIDALKLNTYLSESMAVDLADNIVTLGLARGKLAETKIKLDEFTAKCEGLDISSASNPFQDFLSGETEYCFKDFRTNVVAANLCRSNGRYSNSLWLESLGKLPTKTHDDFKDQVRGGKLIEAYCSFLVMVSQGIVNSRFVEQRKRLLKDLDRRYRKAGFVLFKQGKTPMETALDIVPVSEEIRVEVLVTGPELRSAEGLCEKLCKYLELDYIWVLARKGSEIIRISGPRNFFVSHRVSWIQEAIDLATDLQKPYLSSAGKGWAHGVPVPGVVAIPIRDEDRKRHPAGRKLFVIAEKAGPGQILNRQGMDELLRYSGILATLGDLQEKESHIRHDGLTGLLMKDSWLERCREVLDQLDTETAMVAILDLDRFKNVNDSLGHSQGDRVIRDVGTLLRSQLRDSDIAGRFGGDEFVLFIPDIPIEQAGQTLERTRVSIQDNIRISGQNITTSIGFAMIPEDAGTLSLAFLKADRALYNSKAHGRNLVSRAV